LLQQACELTEVVCDTEATQAKAIVKGVSAFPALVVDGKCFIGALEITKWAQEQS